MAAVEEEVAVEPSSEPAPKEEMPEAPAEPAPQPEPVAAPAVVAAAPITPAASTEITEVIVDVEPSPGAAKFFHTVGEASSTLSTLNSDEVSDGMLELSKRCKNDMKSSFDTFKTHALDVAVVATSTPPSADERAWKLALKQTEWRKLAQLPLAALYAIFALACLCAFAVIYYPKQYGPQLYSKAKEKLIEYQVQEKAEIAGAFIQVHANSAYSAAANSQIAAKAAEQAAKAAEAATEAAKKAAENPAVAAAAAKAAEAAEIARQKVAEKLVELKGSEGGEKPMTSQEANGASV